MSKSFRVDYISGSENILRAQWGFKLELSDKGIKLYMPMAKRIGRESIGWEKVLQANFEATENKKVLSASKALVGGIILGPVGAIAGGMSGSNKKRYFVKVEYLSPKGESRELLLSSKYEFVARKVVSEMQTYLGKSPV